MGEIPFVTGIFPLGARTGTPATVEVTGWNLPSKRATLKPVEAEGIHRAEELSNGLVIGDVSFESEGLPEISEKEPNNELKAAQQVTLPAVVNGHIDPAGDVDVYAITCKVGDKVVAEVTARRLNSPLDSWLKVTDETGMQIAFNDDMDDKGSGLITHQADSYVSFTAISSGRYFIYLGDSQHKGGPEYGYRLRISPPKPDFALRIVPSSLNGRSNAAVPVTVYALRKDGFTGDITFNLKDAPKGFALQGGCIPEGQDKVRATVTFASVGATPLPLAVEGRAVVQGRETMHPAVPADDLLQAFIYHHLVQASGLYAVSGGESRGGRSPFKPVADPVGLVAGGSARVTLATLGKPPGGGPDQLQLQLNEPPEGISIESVTPTPDGVAVAFRTDAKVKPGLRGNLILKAFMERTTPAEGDKKAEKRRWSVGLLPAIPFKVTGTSTSQRN